MIYILLLGVGVLLLWVGSVAIRRGGVGLFRGLGMPPVLVSVIVVSLAMAAPALAVSLQAALRGMPDIALGEIVGNSLANLLLVFGIGALISPMPAPPRTVFRDGGSLLFASVLLLGALLWGHVPLPLGAALVVAWLAYVALAYFTELGRPQQTFNDPSAIEGSYATGFGGFAFAVGLACVSIGARFVIDFAALTAGDFHASRLAIALTILALATCLPQLRATIRSAGRGHSFSASTQVMATTIFVLSVALGLSALAGGLSAPKALAHFDGLMLVGAALFVPAFMLAGWRLTRGHGILLLIGYLAYFVFVVLRSPL